MLISKLCWFQMFDLQLRSQKGDALKRAEINEINVAKMTQKSNSSEF